MPSNRPKRFAIFVDDACRPMAKALAEHHRRSVAKQIEHLIVVAYGDLKKSKSRNQKSDVATR